MPPTPEIRVDQYQITTRDGVSLGATLYHHNNSPQMAVLILGAMGMPQHFYRHYARFLAEQDCAVLTFDYRGIAASRSNGSLWGDRTGLLDWASQDCQAALRWLRHHYPQARLCVVGHSLGGHLLGGAAECEAVDALLGISAQSTYWRHWPLIQQPGIALFWFVLLPLLSFVVGYFPSRWFGLGEPLPRDIALDWARAASNPQGTKGLIVQSDHDHYAEFSGATSFYSFSDDTIMAPKRSVDAILDYYPEACEQSRQHITPERAGVSAIGHNRFFRPEMRETLWPMSYRWLAALETGVVEAELS